jgi:hypothetical protein
VPIYMEISQLHRQVTIVARGKIAPDEIRGMAQQLAESQVRSFAKIIEAAGATTEFTLDQIMRLAEMMRGASAEKRGPIAFVVSSERTAFPQAFANQTEGEGPIRLFTSLREARTWVEHVQRGGDPGAANDGQGARPADPDRQGVMFRGARRRGVPVRSLYAA